MAKKRIVIPWFLGIMGGIANITFAATVLNGGGDDTARWIIGGLCTLLLTICAFILNKVDRNQTRLFEFHAELDKRVVRVETRCEDKNKQRGPSSNGRRCDD